MASNILGKISRERVLSAIVLVIITLVSLLSGGIVLAIVLYLVSIVGFLELTKACGVRKTEEKKINSMEAAGIVATTVYYSVLFMAKDEGMFSQFFLFWQEADFSVVWIIAIFLPLIFLMSVYVFAYPNYTADQVMAAYFSLIYAPVTLSFVYLARQYEGGIYLVWVIFISSWVSDTFAYLVGVMLGKHKLAPVLSPKKSIEGSVGGIVGAVLIGAVYGSFLNSVFGVQYMGGILAFIGGVGSVISQVGDLAASAIKRNHNIKDYGKLIPGHGGIMDRFDSVIFTAPIIYLLIVLFL